MKPWIKLTGAIAMVILAACLGAFFYMKYEMRGFSARGQPSRVEAMLAGYARATAMPASAKALKNPIVDSAGVEQEAMAHFADHCAVCHANNGSGNTMFGNGLYPKPPDLRGQTQQMSDGEIFYIIENGIRMSGMPAFGGQGTDTAEDTWKLVRFIRHLPKLTDQEELEMEHLNPKSPEEMKEEMEEDQFLNGGAAPASLKMNGMHHSTERKTHR